jgi:hypothetical protein
MDPEYFAFRHGQLILGDRVSVLSTVDTGWSVRWISGAKRGQQEFLPKALWTIAPIRPS